MDDAAATTLTPADLDALANRVAERLRGLVRPRLLTRRDLAAWLRVGESTVSALASRGELPPGWLIGGVRRWDEDDVRRHLNARGTRRRRKGRGMRVVG